MFQKPDFLTDYEFRVFQLTNEGLSPKEIANQINFEIENQNRPKVRSQKRDPKQKTTQSISKARVVVRKKIERELFKSLILLSNC